MKCFFLALMFVATLGIVGSAFAQDFRVVALHENPDRPMNASVFASTDPEAVKKYMPDGGAPASMSSFVLFAGDDIVLFDAGQNAEIWSKKLTELEVKPENVKLILITHFHGDHIGGLFQGDERRFVKAKVFASTPEYDFYLLRERQPQGAVFGKIKAAYGEDFVKFEFDKEVFANAVVKVKAIDATGHTPGHTAFLIESAKAESKQEKVLIIGDLLHAAALQFPVPEACASFDQDKEKSVAARKRILDLAIQEKWLVGGMHFPPPSVGTAKKEGKGYALELKK
jgi:glyoxylase-like metal-dependent hydrolase (beta-lactamase superfamily II)